MKMVGKGVVGGGIAAAVLVACATGSSLDVAAAGQLSSTSAGGGVADGGHPPTVAASGGGGSDIELSSSGAGASGTGGFAACAATSIEATRVPLDMYVMVDRSGSMIDDGKWDAVTNAIGSFVSSAKDADQMSMGLQYFPLSIMPACTTAADCGSGACWMGLCSTFVDSCSAADYANPSVPIGPLPLTSQLITSSLGAHSPDGATPTAPALQGAINHAASWLASHSDHTVVVVLATDGMPTECTPTSIGDIAVIAAAGLASGVPTFVIGVGLAQQQLDAVAQYGGTGQALLVDTGGNTTAAFAAALDSVRKSAAGCDFHVPSGGAADPTKVNVQLTPGPNSPAESLPKAADANACGTDLAWYYDDPADPTKLQLCPGACDAFEASADASVQILLGCQSIVK